MWGLRVPARCATAHPWAHRRGGGRSLKVTTVRKIRAGHEHESGESARAISACGVRTFELHDLVHIAPCVHLADHAGVLARHKTGLVQKSYGCESPQSLNRRATMIREIMEIRNRNARAKRSECAPAFGASPR